MLVLLTAGPAMLSPADASVPTFSTQAPPGVTGRLVLPRSRELWQVTPGTGTERRLLDGAPLTTVTQASWSPDARRVAYSLFRFWRPERPAGSDLHLVAVDGGEPTVVLPAEGEDTSFTEPVWTPDGASLVYSAVVRVPGSAFGETTNQVERVPVAGGGRTVLVSDGFSPAVSRDGRQLAFLRAGSSRGEGDVSLWVSDADGRSPRAVLADRRFTGLAFPRFAPAGDRLAFAAVGGPVPIRGTTSGLLPWLAPRLVSAHGPPWDLWEVQVDGSGLRRLTELAEDDPSLAWSPDGRWLAVQGGSGLFLVEVGTRAIHRLVETVGFGGIDWTS